MILSDREIQAALRRGAIRITPQPPDLWSQPEAGQKSPWSSTTLDLRLDAELTVWKKLAAGSKGSIDLFNIGRRAPTPRSARGAYPA
jgi:deoxycytidine triphosphate deaminase